MSIESEKPSGWASGRACPQSRRGTINRGSVSAVFDPFVGPVRYGNCHAWFVFLSSLDILLTSVVLAVGGSEVNPLVEWILVQTGMVGVVVYKFLIVTFVIWVCEFIGRERDGTGRRLAEWTVAITFVPVFLALAQMYVKVQVHGGL
jgi:uncharacterized protein DUF5658